MITLSQQVHQEKLVVVRVESALPHIGSVMVRRIVTTDLMKRNVAANHHLQVYF